MPCDPDEHLFWPGTAEQVRRFADEGRLTSYLWACAMCHQRINLLEAELARRRQLSQGRLIFRSASHPFTRSRGELDQPM